MIFITETLIMFHIELKNFSEITHFSVTKPQKLPSAAENTTETRSIITAGHNDRSGCDDCLRSFT